MQYSPMPEKFQQDPHETADFVEKDLRSAVGRQVRALRTKRGLTISQLASEMAISNGMLSKIENGQTSPSLQTLQSIAQTLRVPITTLFKGYEEIREAMHVKAGEGIDADRVGTRAGHQYSLLGNIAGSAGVTMEPYLISLNHESDVFPTFQHVGLEFLFMLEGAVEYRHGSESYLLNPGDSLIFDADAPHGPEHLIELPARYLSVICYPKEKSTG
ncbi:MAG: XRE family transcriptional regulator [Rhizobiaceae bacterium]